MPKPDLCLFCDKSPCECNRKSSKVPRPVKREKPREEEAAAPAPPPRSALESMRTAALRPPPPVKKPEPKRTYAPPPEQVEMVQAIKTVKTILGGTFLDHDEEKTWAAALREADAPEFRAQLWRSKMKGGKE